MWVYVYATSPFFNLENSFEINYEFKSLDVFLMTNFTSQSFQNFTGYRDKNKNKITYVKRYLLTNRGIKHRIDLTIIFMKKKMKEYDQLKSEIKKERKINRWKIQLLK